MMNYKTRIVNFLKTQADFVWTPEDMAILWKRSKTEVQMAVNALALDGKLKQKKDGTLKLKGSYAA